MQQFSEPITVFFLKFSRKISTFIFFNGLKVTLDFSWNFSHNFFFNFTSFFYIIYFYFLFNFFLSNFLEFPMKFFELTTRWDRPRRRATSWTKSKRKLFDRREIKNFIQTEKKNSPIQMKIEESGKWNTRKIHKKSKKTQKPLSQLQEKTQQSRNQFIFKLRKESYEKLDETKWKPENHEQKKTINIAT